MRPTKGAKLEMRREKGRKEKEKEKEKEEKKRGRRERTCIWGSGNIDGSFSLRP